MGIGKHGTRYCVVFLHSVKENRPVYKGLSYPHALSYVWLFKQCHMMHIYQRLENTQISLMMTL